MKSLLVFSLGLLLILLQSCEGSTQREWTVFNKTNQSITIISNSNFADLETFIIPPKSSKIVAINDLRGGQKEPGETNLHFDNLDLLRPSDSTSVDLKNNSKWEILCQSSLTRVFFLDTTTGLPPLPPLLRILT